MKNSSIARVPWKTALALIAAGVVVAPTAAGVIQTPQISSPLIGVDFTTPGGDSPINWNVISSGASSPATLSNLIDENGQQTGVGFSAAFGGGQVVTLDQSTVAQHINPLGPIDDYVLSQSPDPVVAAFRGLTPGAEYAVWVFNMSSEFGLELALYDVLIEGGGAPINFVQTIDPQDLWINEEIGDDTRPLSDYALFQTADANGMITVTSGLPRENRGGLGGVAIREVPSPGAATILIIGAALSNRRRRSA